MKRFKITWYSGCFGHEVTERIDVMCGNDQYEVEDWCFDHRPNPDWGYIVTEIRDSVKVVLE